MPLTCDQFTAQLSASGLIPADELNALLGALPAERKADAEQLARELVRQKKLTAFQAQQIYQGKGKHLVLGNYVALDKLGQGGMGMVLKAEHRRMKRVVALKVLSPNVTKTPEALRRFQREVEAAARLNHPNIVTAFDADEAAGTHFLVMEYVEGTDLSALVKKNGPLSIDKALPCVIQAARGLEFAHARGIVHRDIKPANLLLDPAGTIKILDMGLARIDSAGAQQDQLTGTGQIMGTVDYMAPEQAMDTKSADARADIYSLGVTLWHLLTGRALYEGDTTVMKLMAHQNKPIPSLRGACPAAPPALEAAFNRMVAKTPDARYQSMGEVIADLERCLTGQATAPSVSLAPGEDSRLSEFLRGMEQTPADRTAQAGAVATRAATVAPATHVFEQTMNMSAPAVDTDPRTEQSLARSVAAELAGRRNTGPRWLARLPVPPRLRVPVLIGGGLAAAALLLAGILLFWHTDQGTVRIEINDPNITAQIDGAGAKLTQLDKDPIELSPGEHGLRIKYGALDFETDKFVLADGDDVRLKVELLAGKVRVTQGDKTIGEGTPPKVVAVGGRPSGAPADDADREFAQWMLAQGFFGEGVAGSRTITIKENVPLPSEPFFVTKIWDPDRPKLPVETLAEGFRLLARLKQFKGGCLPIQDSEQWLAVYLELPTITEVNAYRSEITDKGLAALTKFPNLTYINLHHCRNITIDGLRSLSKLPSGFGTLEIDPDSLAAGKYPLPELQKLQNALPNCRIQQSGGKPIEGLLPAGSAVAQPSTWPFDPSDGRQYAWSEPEHLGPGVNSPADETLWGIADDELTIYFSRSGDGLHASRRASREVPFPAPSLRLLEGKQFIGAVTSDGLIAVHATPAERRKESIRITTRQSADQPFGDAVLMDPPVNTGEHTQHPVLSADGLTLLVTSTRAGGDWGDVWMFTRDARDRPFANAVRLPEPVNSPAWEMPAFITNDRKMLIASTQSRSAEGTTRTFRYFMRADAASPFGPALPMDLPLGAAEGVPHNGGFRLSGDGRSVYFHTPKLPGALGRKDIYVCRRVPIDDAIPTQPADRTAALALAPAANQVTVRLPSGQLASVGRGQGDKLPEGPFDLIRLDFSAFHAPAGYISDVFLPAIEHLTHLEEINTFHETAFTTQELTRLAKFPCRQTLTKFGAGYLDLNTANLDVLKEFPHLTYLGFRAARVDAALFDRIRQEHPALRAMCLTDLGTEQTLDSAAQDALANLPLEELVLLHGGVIDRRLGQRLATMPDLRRLTIVVIALTDEPAIELAACPKLEQLTLAFSGVGDRTVDALASAQQLRNLNVYMTKATVPALRKLSESLPRCEIYSDKITIPARQ